MPGRVDQDHSGQLGLGHRVTVTAVRLQLGGHWGASVQIRATDQRAFVHGRTAFVTCVERIGAAELAATNVFTREHGIWKMVHHHASPIAPEQASERPPPNPSELN